MTYPSVVLATTTSLGGRPAYTSHETEIGVAVFAVVVVVVAIAIWRMMRR